jgi:hypothetical protein
MKGLVGLTLLFLIIMWLTHYEAGGQRVTTQGLQLVQGRLYMLW